MSESWKSFWLGTLAAVVIAIGAGVFYNGMEISSAEKFSTSNTRLGD